MAVLRRAQHATRTSRPQRAGHILFARRSFAEHAHFNRANRHDELDATHSPQFHQIEGLYVDENVSVADLKGALEFFMRELFGSGTEVEFRPHYFPFTEPSLEVYVKSKALKGGEQWIEVAGCGMVHPAVFEQVNKARGDKAYDPEKWSGYAFGLGMDRLAMILFDMPDLRLFAQNDLRFLRQLA